jgi:hypothetical protein
MIHEVDAALRSLLTSGPLAGFDVDVSFDMPTRRWAARHHGPVVNAYLYDIREDVDRRQLGYTPVVEEGNGVVKRRQHPRWFRLSYLMTAWAGHSEEEHQLLSALLAGFVSHELLTAAELPGTLGALELAVSLSISGAPVASRSLAEIWSALDSELRPSLDVVVTAPLPVHLDHEAGPPVAEAPSINMRRR